MSLSLLAPCIAHQSSRRRSIDSGKKRRAQRLTFFVRRLPGGERVFQPKGWGSKSSCLPSKICLPWVSKRGIWDVPGILPGCPGPWACSKSLCKKSSCAFFVPYWWCAIWIGDSESIFFCLFTSLPEWFNSCLRFDLRNFWQFQVHPVLVFWRENGKENHQKKKVLFFIPTKPPKSLEMIQKGKTLKNKGIPHRGKKQGIQKNNKERQGHGRQLL